MSSALFDSWAERCMSIMPTSSSSAVTKTEESPEKMNQTQSKNHFEQIVASSSSNDDDNADDKNRHTVLSTELALLISKLGPPLSSDSYRAKVRAFSCFSGALQGISSYNNKSQSVVDESSKVITGLSLKMMKLMSVFLLEHCAPILPSPSSVTYDDDNNLPTTSSGDGNDASVEEVRDASLLCLSYLLQTPIITQQEEEDKKDEGETLKEYLHFRIITAQKAVKSRCTSLDDMDIDEDDDDNDDDMVCEGYDPDNQDEEMNKHLDFSKALSGLSLLPRAKRSLCFRVLEGAVIGVSSDITSKTNFDIASSDALNSSSKEELRSFATFSAFTLHGETDPRCLMQMLKLLKQILLTIAPIFQHADKEEDKGGNFITKGFRKNTQQTTTFPYTQFFDSVAPYYPVRFTPPPNDPYGITREALHSTLMDILTTPTFSPSGNGTDKDDDGDNITLLAMTLFLERLSPPSSMDLYGDDDDDDAAPENTVQDRIDALADLTQLLTSASSPPPTTAVSNLTEAIVKELSNVLIRCHEHASIAASSDANNMENKDRILATDCRNFATKMALEFEKEKNLKKQNKFFWDIFVQDVIQNLSSIISSSPQSQKGRTATAYIASLCACGSQLTLTLCLNACLPPLLNTLQTNINTNDDDNNNNKRDEERMCAAAYGIGAFFSSCRVSLEVITKSGIDIHPHPLDEYGSSTLRALCAILDDVFEAGDLEVASLKALESVLQCTPLELFSKDDVTLVRDIVLKLAKGSMKNLSKEDESTTNTTTSTASKDIVSDWKIASARMIGSMVGFAVGSETITISEQSQESKSSLLHSDPEIVAFVKDVLMPQIFFSCLTSQSTGDTSKRYDWMLLADACNAGEQNVSELIVSKLLSMLQDEIKNVESNNDGKSKAQLVAMALSHVLEKGGPAPCITFHSLSRPNVTPMNIIQSLVSSKKSDEIDVEMSTLALPTARRQQKSEADEATEFAFSILPYIIPAYRENIPKQNLNELIVFAEQILPPLSDWDSVKLCVVLPILSIILSNEKLDVKDVPCNSLMTMAPYLAEYALNDAHDNSSRSTAASCVFSIIKSFQMKNEAKCLGQTIIKDVISPIIVRCAGDSTGTQKKQYLLEFEDAIKLCALIGSAAACHGGSSSRTADEVARLLVLMSCEGAATAPSFGIISPLDLTRDSDTEGINIMSVITASAFGSMFSLKAKGSFWKQRLVHKVLPVILSPINSNEHIGDDMPNSEIGLLLCACHIESCISIHAMGETKKTKLVSLLVRGLEKCASEESRTISELRVVLLGSLMKVMADVPDSVVPHLSTIMPSLLMMLNIISANNLAGSDIRPLLLSLQMLKNFAASTNPSIQRFFRAYSKQVIFYLSNSLDHPSLHVRQASAHLINVCILPE